MARYNHLPIFQSGYDLVLKIYRITHHFPREYKYTLGQKLKDISADFLDCIVTANSQEHKTAVLNEARTRLERLRIHVRLAHDLKIITLAGYESICRSLEELSRQLSGWLE
ncbi:four helix bundle protein, partial [Patescibacteria group bacterium]|nr:four helix bundle protein [Patescibacteria group bacterium]